MESPGTWPPPLPRLDEVPAPPAVPQPNYDGIVWHVGGLIPSSDSTMLKTWAAHSKLDRHRVLPPALAAAAATSLSGCICNQQQFGGGNDDLLSAVYLAAFVLLCILCFMWTSDPYGKCCPSLRRLRSRARDRLDARIGFFMSRLGLFPGSVAEPTVAPASPRSRPEAKGGSTDWLWQCPLRFSTINVDHDLTTQLRAVFEGHAAGTTGRISIDA